MSDFFDFDQCGDNKGSGVGIMLTSTLYQHVHEIRFHKGRVPNIKLGFKRNHTLNIMCLYLPAGRDKQTNPIKRDCNQFIDQLLRSRNCSDDNYKNYDIIMGDLNCYPKEKTNLNYHIIQTAKLKGFKDMAKYHAINHAPEITRISHRIDYIFGNNNILNGSIHTFTQTIPPSHFTSDHEAVITLLQNDLFKPTKLSNNHHCNDIKNKPNYSMMNEDLWDDYEVQSKSYFKNRFRYIDIENITSQEDLDHAWNIFEHSIQHIKNLIIPTKKVHSKTFNHLYPLYIRQLNNHVISIYKIKQYLNLKHMYIRNKLEKPEDNSLLLSLIPDEIWNVYFKNWTTIRDRINQIAKSNDHDIILRHYITKEIFYAQKSEIYKLYNHLKQKRDDLLSQWKVERIDHFINQRNFDLSTNQTRMINSILQRKPRRITLDRLIFKDDNDQTIFTNNPKIIEKEAIKHYQNIGKHENPLIYNSLNDLPMPWSDIYDPSNNSIDNNCWNLLQQKIEITDVMHILKDSPSNKAPGPSQITYEDLKHLHPDVLELLTLIFNLCIHLDTIPSKWRDALLFPIPKPHDWDSNLSNTRPITLLETPRKLMVSVFSRRLNETLAKYNILQFNNRAGVLGQSCLEPLFQIQHLIEHARIFKNPILIAIQDLSKAYDRVDIALLRLALQRIKIPSKIITFIINLFSNRYNSIILPNGNLAPYKVLQGIDQGEVISPLLWNIYYDPLFSHINKLSNLAYKCDTKKIKNIYQKHLDITHSYELSLVGYLDDTTWFSPSLEKLELKLDIAHSFYDMAKIKVNIDKYKILTNQKLTDNIRNIQLTINGRQTEVEIVPKYKGTRILGLYINPLDRHHQTLIKARSIIMAHVITMRNKKITHSHAIYIINRVIFPKLEYLFQHTILNYTQAQKLVVPLKKLFKKFFSLPLNTADNIIYNNMFPHIDNLLDLLVKSQTNSLLALFNTDTLRPIAIQKLDILTQELWYLGIPQDINKYIGKISTPSYLSRSLALLEQYQIHLDLTVSYGIIGGHTPIVDYLPDLSSNDYKSLRNKRIMYLDQLVSPDGNYLLTWNEVKRLNNNNFKGPKPKWFKLLENDFTLSNYRTLTYPLTDNYSIPTRLQNIPVRSSGSHKKHNEWTYHWNASIQNCVIGKTYVQDTDTHSSISTMEHYIPINNSLLVNDSSSQPLRSSPLILIPCTGCHLNDNSLVLLDVRIKCSISIRTIRLSVFNIFHRSNQEHKKYANLLLKKYFVSTKPLHFIRHSAHSIYLAQHNINTITPTHTSLSANSPSSVNDDIINQLILPIQSALLCIDSIKLSLIDIAKKFLPFTNFEFYSDGSVSDIGTINSKSGFGWLQTNPLIPQLSFNGSSIFFPSSFKSESLAILTILLTTSPTISPRRRLKQNNFLIWDLISWLISHHYLTVHLVKVKGHSNIKGNDQADALAKEGRLSVDLILINHKFFQQSSLALFNYNHLYIIDHNVRKWANTPIQSRIFNMAVNNSSLSPINHQITHGDIDWYYTKHWINYNPTDTPTSSKL
ncbi:hypothetical protein RirG_196760 [Rhizophagus irregularis DAOM 197198w]|uniref:Reverse transcriptase domain-containing protein n=1 Tax=Rhizophagus irregularis (strain DAOM 197198w) TaxID=1432141 RepID=A0A015KG24_RHIIW|nr:hypothetical protein RirG_196760 [Rhizophagus irregularis DAOM 197198w]